MEYNILKSQDNEELVKLVNEAITNGWQIVGRHTVVQGNDRYYKEWSQTMVKEIKPGHID